jgi:hypothetical protein
MFREEDRCAELHVSPFKDCGGILVAGNTVRNAEFTTFGIALRPAQCRSWASVRCGQATAVKPPLPYASYLNESETRAR